MGLTKVLVLLMVTLASAGRMPLSTPPQSSPLSPDPNQPSLDHSKPSHRTPLHVPDSVPHPPSYSPEPHPEPEKPSSSKSHALPPTRTSPASVVPDASKPTQGYVDSLHASSFQTSPPDTAQDDPNPRHTTPVFPNALAPQSSHGYVSPQQSVPALLGMSHPFRGIPGLSYPSLPVPVSFPGPLSSPGPRPTLPDPSSWGTLDAPVQVDLYINIACPQSELAFSSLAHMQTYLRDSTKVKVKVHAFAVPYLRASFYIAKAVSAVCKLTETRQVFPFLSLLFHNKASFSNKALYNASDAHVVALLADLASTVDVDRKQFVGYMNCSNLEKKTRAAWRTAVSRGVINVPSVLVQGRILVAPPLTLEKVLAAVHHLPGPRPSLGEFRQGREPRPQAPVSLVSTSMMMKEMRVDWHPFVPSGKFRNWVQDLPESDSAIL